MSFFDDYFKYQKSLGKKMTLSQIVKRQQKLLALQVLLLTFLLSCLMITSAIVYAKTTLYDKQNSVKKIRKIKDNKVFEQMYKGSEVAKKLQ